MSTCEAQSGNSTKQQTLYVALELGAQKWLIATGVGDARRPRRKQLAAGDLAALEAELLEAKRRWGLSATAQVVSCYEAGRDGFWLARVLEDRGIDNVVVDPASINVPRRHRTIKTDRLDAESLLSLLVRHHGGEPRVWSVVRVPSEENENARRLHREWKRMQQHRTRVSNQIRANLATVGLGHLPVREVAEHLHELRTPTGKPLPSRLLAELERQLAHRQFLAEQMRDLERERSELVRHSDAAAAKQVRALISLRGVGQTSAWPLVLEFFSWRNFQNRKQVAALAGLVGAPYNSGQSVREQGITKAGNKRIRTLMIELAWVWLRYQPDSKLSHWFQQRWGPTGKRSRKVGIVALARKLLIALWRMAQFGEIPEGALLGEPRLAVDTPLQ